MGDQLLTLVWLRFTLLRHTMTAGKAASMILATLVLMFILVLSFGFGIGLFFAGYYSNSPWMVLGLADACVVVYLAVWTMMLLQEIQRAEVIDFRKMLYLPVSPRMVFLLNYAASLFSPALFLFTLPFTGLTLGLTVRFGWPMLFLFPIGFAFYFMLTSWSYYLHGLLAILMENKRRRRVILTLVPFLFVLVMQVPNFMNAAFLNHHRTPAPGNPQSTQTQPPHLPDIFRDTLYPRGAFAAANAIIPLGWLPYGAYALVERRFLPALAALAGIALLTACGLGLGFRSTMRYYSGTTRGASAAKRTDSTAADSRRRPLVMRSIPFVADDTSAMALASLRMYLRHPQIYLMILSPLIMAALIPLVMKSVTSSDASPFIRSLIPLIVVVLPAFTFAHLQLNLFGMDRAGFRSLILLPTPRHKYLLARNLALLPIVGTITTALILLCAVFLRPPIAASIASVFQALQLFLFFSIVGNFASLYFPYRIAEGMRRTEQPGWNVLVGIIVVPALSGLVVSVALLCRAIDAGIATWGGFPIPLFTLLGPIAFLVLLAFLYHLSLPVAGDHMLRREQKMLDKLIRDRE